MSRGPWWRTRIAGVLPLTDVVLAAAVGLLMATELADLHSRLDVSIPVLVPGGIVAVLTATVAARRAAPLTAYVVNGSAVVCYVALGYPGEVYPWTNALVLYAVAVNATPGKALLGLVLAVLGATTYAAVSPNPDRPVDLAFIMGAWIVVWAAGQATAARRARLEEHDRVRQRQAEAVVAAERARMGREVHDIVGHSLNVMVMHASAALRLADRDPAVAATALETVKATGRQALTELDNLLDLMREPHEAAALNAAVGVAALPALCERVAGEDLKVILDTGGQPDHVSAAVDIIVYRVAQEALTNVVKHARASRAEVHVRFTDDRVELNVVDDGCGPAEDSVGGRGLNGLTERVEMLRGTLTTGRSALGGYSIRVVLPTRGDA